MPPRRRDLWPADIWPRPVITSAPVKPRIKRPIPRRLLPLPPKTITTKPELLPPFTNIAINPQDELIDLVELTSYGRYAIITQNDDYRKQFVVSDNCSTAQEVDNPAYAIFVERNRKTEEENKAALNKYEAAMEDYREHVRQYTKARKEGVLLPDVKDEEPSKQSIFRPIKSRTNRGSGGWAKIEGGDWKWVAKPVADKPIPIYGNEGNDNEPYQ